MTAFQPLALYIHFPWCVKKCPYCDFNSHEAIGSAVHEEYLKALLLDLEHERKLYAANVQLQSIFIGGGTPSLASGDFYQQLLDAVRASFNCSADLEITLEANPGASEYDRFEAYLAAGVNRLSLGVQSFSPWHLQRLGRIHTSDQAVLAYEKARAAGFRRINLDIMFGLPEQSVQQGLADLQQAINLAPEHISWYQLTIEPNTAFYSKPPVLDTETSHELWAQGRQLLAAAGFKQYEVSAYAKASEICRHNQHYWRFGDYAALGAGAHGKLTQLTAGTGEQVWRYHKTRLPQHYLARCQRVPVQQVEEGATLPHPFIGQAHTLSPADLHFEYLLNKLRLREPLAKEDYEQHTGQSWQAFQPKLQELAQLGYLHHSLTALNLTEQGFAFLDELLTRF